MTKFNLKSSFKIMCLVFGLGALVTSCDNNDDNPMPVTKNTITAVVSSNSDYSVLKAAVVKANLATTLDGAGPFTVFAPNNDAFANSGFTSSSLDALPADQLKSILLYHTLASKVLAADIATGTNNMVATANGANIFVTKNAKGVFVNGWKVTKADIMTDNGVIHSIEHVLMPPTANIVTLAQSNSNLSYLVAAVLRASQGKTDVAKVLTSAGPFTVFAPTNQAFIDAGFPTIASIQAADPDVLASILTYHVISARAFSSDLSDGQMLATANGASLKVGIGAGATVKGNGNASPANITAFNILATNGVVHVIDKVLLP